MPLKIQSFERPFPESMPVCRTAPTFSGKRLVQESTHDPLGCGSAAPSGIEVLGHCHLRVLLPSFLPEQTPEQAEDFDSL